MKFKYYHYLPLILLVIFIDINARNINAQTNTYTLHDNTLEQIYITSGKISQNNQFLYIDNPAVRGQIKSTKQTAQIYFQYLGESSAAQPLASGELRRQIGLKLNAQDTCNLLYVMWHIEPKSQLAVSIKQNTGMNTHAQCGANGYINLKAEYSTPIPKIIKYTWHTLTAQIWNGYLFVYADNALVWKGVLPPSALALEQAGIVGFRTDNGKFKFKFSSF